MKIRTVNNTIYEVIKNENGVLDVKSTIGVNGVTVYFCCLEIEWNDDFVQVQHRLKALVENSIHSI